jgi:phosphoglycolate phosphatase
MRLRGVRCVLFDLDGTLLDSATDLGQAADDMRRARGLPSLAGTCTEAAPARAPGAC